MLSRALSLATVTLLIGCFAAGQAQAQNLEAGKSPAQIFAGACNACHKSPRGLLKTVPAGSLPGFLRQHYTTSGDMASLLSAFLVSNGAADTRLTGNQPKSGKDARPGGTPGGSPDQLDRFGRRQRLSAPSQEAARPEGEPGEAGKPAQARAQAAIERGPDGRKLSAKHRLSKRGQAGAEETPKTEGNKDEAKEESAKGVAAKEETPKDETAKIEGDKSEHAKPSGEGKSETAKSESAKSESAKSESAKSESAKSESAKSESAKSESTKSESAKIEPPKETGGGETPILRPDPVPPVTPAPATPPAVSAAVSSGAPEPAAAPPLAAPKPALPPAVTASVPPLPPVAPAGPPAPPISQ